MEVRFEDDHLARLEAGIGTAGHGRDVDKIFRQRMVLIRSAPDERDFYALASLNFKKREGEGERRSMRLNKQWRLYLRLEGRGPAKVAVIERIADDH